MISINEWCKKADAYAEEKGWNESPPTFGEFIALLHTEASEAFEEYRNGRYIHEIYFSTDKAGLQKPEGIPIEIADILYRIFHWAGHNGVDLTAALNMKHAYNLQRPKKHGGKVL